MGGAESKTCRNEGVRGSRPQPSFPPRASSDEGRGTPDAAIAFETTILDACEMLTVRDRPHQGEGEDRREGDAGEGERHLGRLRLAT